MAVLRKLITDIMAVLRKLITGVVIATGPGYKFSTEYYVTVSLVTVYLRFNKNIWRERFIFYTSFCVDRYLDHHMAVIPVKELIYFYFGLGKDQASLEVDLNWNFVCLA